MARPQPFKAILRDMRNTTHCGVGDFKLKLDLYLSTITDEPTSMGAYAKKPHATKQHPTPGVEGRGEAATNIFWQRENPNCKQNNQKVKSLTASRTVKIIIQEEEEKTLRKKLNCNQYNLIIAHLQPETRS